MNLARKHQLQSAAGGRPGHAFTLLEVLVVVAIIALLIAIVVDGLLNPRDEQTAQQGDI